MSGANSEKRKKPGGDNKPPSSKPTCGAQLANSVSVASNRDNEVPTTPSKSPPSKKGKGDQDDPTLSTLAALINSRSDKLELLIQSNMSEIADLKIQVSTVCHDVSSVRAKMVEVEQLHMVEKERIDDLAARTLEIERYSRRWNLRLNGVSELIEKDQVRMEVIRICQAVVPENKKRLPEVIDTVHRLGAKKKDGSARSIIIQFSSRVHRAAVWAAAKDCQYLRDNHLRFAEDLCQVDRDNREKMWPLVDAARKQGKRAFFVGGRCFIEKDGKNEEVFPPPPSPDSMDTTPSTAPPCPSLPHTTASPLPTSTSPTPATPSASVPPATGTSPPPVIPSQSTAPASTSPPSSNTSLPWA